MTAPILAGIILAHLFGDYVLQSDWMANEKTHRWWPAVVHAATYTAAYVLVTRSVVALAIIGVTHAVIDHYRLARHVVWAKNFLAPAGYNRPWSECTGTGYPPDKAPFMAVWLMVIADNALHLLINFLAIWGAS